MRLLTKAQREASRAAQFTNMLNSGWEQIDYKNLVLFVHYSDLLIKTYWGNAAKHSDYYKYRTAELLAAKIEEYKKQADGREQYKKEQKERNAGHTSSHAATAAAIRTELKKEFPNIKFSVTSETFAGGNSVHISWTNGETTDRVKEFTNKYQYGHFNGMEDIYEDTNHRDDIPQVKYVSESRTLSDEIIKEVATKLQEVKTYTEEQKNSYNESPETEAKQLLYQTSIPLNYISLSVVRCDNPSNRHPFKIVFETEQQPEQPKKQPTTEKSGKIQIVDYSEKAIAVIGETKEIKEHLKELGGKFNPRLTCGAGWIFSKSKLEHLKAFLTKIKAGDETATKHEETTTEEPKEQPTNEAEAEAEQIQINESEILPTPKNTPFELESLKIIWHEGRHISGATFENIIFKSWEEIQRAFYILWLVNEKGQNGGYTKVKCEITLKGEAPEVVRVDITNAIDNGDFNPSVQHISDYLKTLQEAQTHLRIA